MARRTPEAQKHIDMRNQRRLEWIQRHAPACGSPTEGASQIRCYFDACELDVWLTTGTWGVVGTNEYYKDDWRGFQIKVQEEVTA